MTHQISISANVYDESGGNVYVMAFLKSGNVTTDSLKSNILDGSWDYANIAVRLLPTLEPNLHTIMTGNISVAYANLGNTTDITTTDSALVLEAYVNYDLFMFVKDIHDNSKVVDFGSSLSISVDTTRVANFPTNLLNAGPDDFSEFREGPLKPNLFYNEDPFGFYEQDTRPDWKTKLYANIDITPSESVVGNVYNVVFEEEESNLANVVTFVQSNPASMTLLNSYPMVYKTTKNASEQITNIFQSSANNTLGDFSIGKTYYVYSVIEDKGFGVDIAKLEKTVVTGTSPNVTLVDVRVVEYVFAITPDYIDNITWRYDPELSGSGQEIINNNNNYFDNYTEIELYDIFVSVDTAGKLYRTHADFNEKVNNNDIFTSYSRLTMGLLYDQTTIRSGEWYDNMISDHPFEAIQLHLIEPTITERYIQPKKLELSGNKLRIYNWNDNWTTYELFSSSLMNASILSQLNITLTDIQTIMDDASSNKESVFKKLNIGLVLGNLTELTGTVYDTIEQYVIDEALSLTLSDSIVRL